MRRWEDAEGAIALLKQSGAGRATFLPLDTLRSGSQPPAPKGPGIVGLARDLVEMDLAATRGERATSLLPE